MLTCGQKVKNIVRHYKKELIKLDIKPEKIILFGSCVNGMAREDSDIDLIIVSRDFKKFNLRERLEILGLAAGRVFEPIEALGYTPEEIKKANPVSILKEALTTGIILN